MSSVDSSPQKTGKHPVESKLQSLRSAQSNTDNERAIINAKRPAETRLTSKDLKRPLYVIKESAEGEEYEEERTPQTVEGGDRKTRKGDGEDNVLVTMSLKKEMNPLEIATETNAKPLNEKEYIYEVSSEIDNKTNK